jgi:hypothetical protein
VVVAAASWLTSWCCQCQTFVSLVALPRSRDLLLCAKHLFVAAISGSSRIIQARRARPKRRVQALSSNSAEPGSGVGVSGRQRSVLQTNDCS